MLSKQLHAILQSTNDELLEHEQVPCRTGMKGTFPLNGTYFQVNEVCHRPTYFFFLMNRVEISCEPWASPLQSWFSMFLWIYRYLQTTNLATIRYTLQGSSYGSWKDEWSTLELQCPPYSKVVTNIHHQFRQIICNYQQLFFSFCRSNNWRNTAVLLER